MSRGGPLRMLATAAAIVVAAVLLALASSVVKGTRMEVQDWDCPPAPSSCARPVVVGGFPYPYISDFHGISAVGDASLVSALLGDDILHQRALLANVLLYALLVSGIGVVAVRARRR